MCGSSPFHSEKMSPTLLCELAARTEGNAAHIGVEGWEAFLAEIIFVELSLSM